MDALLHPVQKSLTDLRSDKYVESRVPVKLLGTKRSIKKGTRKMFIPASRKTWILEVSGQV